MNTLKEMAVDFIIALVAFLLSAGAHPGKKPSEVCRGGDQQAAQTQGP